MIPLHVSNIIEQLPLYTYDTYIVWTYLVLTVFLKRSCDRRGIYRGNSIYISFSLPNETILFCNHLPSVHPTPSGTPGFVPANLVSDTNDSKGVWT